MKNISFTNRFLGGVEKIGNKIPDPFYLFTILALFVLLVSWIGSAFGISVVHPGSGETLYLKNLLSVEGIRRIFTEAVNNFITFPPLGMVLVTIIGIGVAEKSGLFNATLKFVVRYVPRRFLTFTLIIAGVCANIIADSGIVVVPPLGALLFIAMGRHPIAGLAAGFAAVCGGFSANLFISSLDPLLSGFTNASAQLIDPAYNVYPTANYYFMIASTFLISGVFVWVTNRIVEPRLGKYEDRDGIEHESMEPLAVSEKLGLIRVLFASIVFFGLILFITVGPARILIEEGGLLAPLYKSVVIIIMAAFLLTGTIYGITAGTIRNSRDIIRMMHESLGLMGSYIILAFAAGQFIAYFNWSNLGIVVAVKGAGFLKSAGIIGLPLLITFLVFSTVLNIFIYSASAKWAIFAPVFVPMFMLMGFSPETTQVVYRVGDSITNIITPLLPYFPIVLVFAKKYDKDMTLGKLLSVLMPYSLVLFIVWTIFLVIWIVAGIPLGPGAGIYYTLPK